MRVFNLSFVPNEILDSAKAGQDLIHKSIYIDSYEIWLDQSLVDESEVAEKGFSSAYYEAIFNALNVEWKSSLNSKGFYNYFAIHQHVDYRLVIDENKEIWLKVCKDVSEFDFWTNKNVQGLTVILASRVPMKDNIQSLSKALSVDLKPDYKNLLNLYSQLKGKRTRQEPEFKLTFNVQILENGTLKSVWRQMCQYGFFVLNESKSRVSVV